MPKYKTRKIRAAMKRRNAAVQTVPRDKRMLMRWARKGTAKDYEKLRELAGSKIQEAPLGRPDHPREAQQDGAPGPPGADH